jgi:hypothetical protein
MHWAYLFTRRLRDGRLIVVAPLRSIGGPLTVLRTFTKAGRRLESRGFAWHIGHLEFFPELDVNGDGQPDQLAMGWAQYLTADGTERRDLPRGEQGRSVAYVLDLDVLANGSWGGQSRESIPSLVDPRATEFGLVIGWSFPLDRTSEARSSSCLAVRPTESGHTRFACFGSSASKVVEYTVSTDANFETRLVCAEVNDNYRDALMQTGWDPDSIRSFCDRLGREVTWLKREWQPIRPVE